MVIEVNNLVKKYGEMTAVDHLSLSINEGEVFGLLGPNGSGKTTTINCILSLLKYQEGEIKIFNKEMTPKSYDIKRDIGVVMQNVAVFDELTVYENVRYFCGLYIKDKEKCKKMTEEAIEFVGLVEFKKFYPKKLSGGLLRRLNIACGIAHKPKLVILDEPTVAVDPQSRNNILEGILKLNESGVTVIYTSHYMEEIEQICTRIAIMDKGRIIAEGTKEEIKELTSGGEKITVELFKGEYGDILEKVKALDTIMDASIEGNNLKATARKSVNGLMEVLNCLNENNIAFGNIYSEKPTLNDVFLEITGKELRDNV